MVNPLRPGTAAIVKSTVPALEAHGVTITTTMYDSLMRDPDVASMFNQTDQANGRQPKALAAAVLAYARHIDHPERLDAALGLIVERHVAVMVKPEQYPVVGAALLDAIRTVLGEAATPQILDAWADAYRFLAEILIARESARYEDSAAEPGGWRGWRPFRVAARVQETDTVTSFRLIPADGGSVIRHKPGQFLTFRLDRDGMSTRRSYSISSGPCSEAYRISVKRNAQGLVSNWFHDCLHEGDLIEAAPPAGNFTLDRHASAPVLLVSAGIGITPFMSMILDAAAREDLTRIHLVHGDHCLHTMPFAKVLAELTTGNRPLSVDLCITAPSPADISAIPALRHGRISADVLSRHIGPDTQIFLCGPRGFQRELIIALLAQGVPAGHIHHEFFGSDEAVSSDTSANSRC